MEVEPKTLQQVRLELSNGNFEFSLHALRRVTERDISNAEIRQAGLKATIIEEYPSDKYSPSCLLLGFTQEGRLLHIQVALLDTSKVKIVTIYEPDPNVWAGYSRRRR